MENCCRCITNRKITWKSRTESLHGALCCFALDGSSHVNSLHKQTKQSQAKPSKSCQSFQTRKYKKHMEALLKHVEACGRYRNIWKRSQAESASKRTESATKSRQPKRLSQQRKRKGLVGSYERAQQQLRKGWAGNEERAEWATKTGLSRQLEERAESTCNCKGMLFPHPTQQAI